MSEFAGLSEPTFKQSDCERLPMLKELTEQIEEVKRYRYRRFALKLYRHITPCYTYINLLNRLGVSD